MNIKLKRHIVWSKKPMQFDLRNPCKRIQAPYNTYALNVHRLNVSEHTFQLKCQLHI